MPMQGSRPISKADLAAQGRLKSEDPSSGGFSSYSTRGSSSMMPPSPDRYRATGMSASPVTQLEYEPVGYGYDERFYSPILDLPETLYEYLFQPIVHGTHVTGKAIVNATEHAYHGANFVTDPSHAGSGIGSRASYTSSSIDGGYRSFGRVEPNYGPRPNGLSTYMSTPSASQFATTRKLSMPGSAPRVSSALMAPAATAIPSSSSLISAPSSTVPAGRGQIPYVTPAQQLRFGLK